MDIELQILDSTAENGEQYFVLGKTRLHFLHRLHLHIE